MNTVVTDKFKKQSGQGYNFLKKRVYPGDVMNGMLVYMQANQADGGDAAIEFLTRHEGVWTKWVSQGAAKKIKAAL